VRAENKGEKADWHHNMRFNRTSASKVSNLVL